MTQVEFVERLDVKQSYLSFIAGHYKYFAAMDRINHKEIENHLELTL